MTEAALVEGQVKLRDGKKGPGGARQGPAGAQQPDAGGHLRPGARPGLRGPGPHAGHRLPVAGRHAGLRQPRGHVRLGRPHPLRPRRGAQVPRDGGSGHQAGERPCHPPPLQRHAGGGQGRAPGRRGAVEAVGPAALRGRAPRLHLGRRDQVWLLGWSLLPVLCRGGADQLPVRLHRPGHLPEQGPLWAAAGSPRRRPRGPRHRGGASGPGGPGGPAAGEAAQPLVPLRPAGQRRGRPQPVQLLVGGQPLGRQRQQPARRVAGAVLVLRQRVAGGARAAGFRPRPRGGRAGRLQAAAQAAAAAAAAGGGPPELLGQRHRHGQPLLLLGQLLVLRGEQPGRVARGRRVRLAAQPAAGGGGARAPPVRLPARDRGVPGARRPAAPLRHAPQPAPGPPGPGPGGAGRPGRQRSRGPGRPDVRGVSLWLAGRETAGPGDGGPRQRGGAARPGPSRALGSRRPPRGAPSGFLCPVSGLRGTQGKPPSLNRTGGRGLRGAALCRSVTPAACGSAGSATTPGPAFGASGPQGGVAAAGEPAGPGGPTGAAGSASWIPAEAAGGAGRGWGGRAPRPGPARPRGAAHPPAASSDSPARCPVTARSGPLPRRAGTARSEVPGQLHSRVASGNVSPRQPCGASECRANLPCPRLLLGPGPTPTPTPTGGLSCGEETEAREAQGLWGWPS
ncbi:protein Dok-7 isoform X1 [Myotis daubentonii]|uniref:protein Dok-7 isoform X1 n=1 Tax=Myotis daubentonii TaxID=98922 RepID=UPI002872B709|nr:protein Dok-7 isoform X1 [Myotis daubentonii]